LHTAAWGIVLVGPLETPPASIVTVVAVFAAWPIAVAVLVAQPALAPVPGATAVDGPAVLMIVFAGVGLTFSVIVILSFAGWLDGGPITGAIIALMVIRGAIHLHAGIVVRRSADAVAVHGAVRRYAIAAGASSVALVVLAILWLERSEPSRATLLAVALTPMLLGWPLAVRRAVRRVERVRQTPDRGLTTLGWLVLAGGVTSLAFALSTALTSTDAENAITANRVAGYMSALQPRNAISPWIGVVAAAIQSWAGVELVLMTRRRQQAAIAYAVTTVCVAILGGLAADDTFQHLATAGAGPVTFVLLTFLSVALGLAVPVIALVLVTRRLPPEPPPPEVFD
jgi:hypothetical protein